MSCNYKDDDIVKYTEGTMPDKKFKAFEQHLKSCRSCQMKIDIISNVQKEASSMPDGIRINLIPSIKKKLQPKAITKTNTFRAILKPSLLALSLIFAFSLLWPFISKGLTMIFNQRFISGSAIVNPTQISTPSIQPSQQPENSAPYSTPISPNPNNTQGTFSLAFYRSTMKFEEVLALGSISTSELARYEEIPIDKIQIEDTPFLTDDRITGYSSDTQTIEISEDDEERLSQQLISAASVPFVVTLNGERLFWGVFVHPISSINPPQAIPLLNMIISTDIKGFTLSQLEYTDFNNTSLVEFFYS